MGCDITCFVEVRTGGEWCIVDDPKNPDYFLDPLWERHYGLFGWLAGVCNYVKIAPLSPPRGLPQDLSVGVRDCYNTTPVHTFSHSYYTLRELLDVDYSVAVTDRREEDDGVIRVLPLWDFLGPEYQRMLETLKALGPPDDVRIVFWFDW